MNRKKILVSSMVKYTFYIVIKFIVLHFYCYKIGFFV